MNKYEQKPGYIVDLHGYTTQEAGIILNKLVVESKYRHVRVITGKGDLRNGPVLRTFVQQFLKQRGIKFETAKISNGGDGALEVYFNVNDGY